MKERHVYGGSIMVVGLLLAGIQITHSLRQFDIPLAIAFDAVPFVALSLALTYAGFWVGRSERYEPDVLRIMAWSLGGVLVFASIAALMMFSQRVATGTLERASIVAVDNVTVGMLSGTLVGLYDAESRLRRRNLENERNRIEEFAKKAADLNNYGRAIAQSDGVEGVSAFCLEAVATLLDFRESAFIELTGDEAHFVGDTTIGTDRESLASLGRDATEQDPGTIVVRQGEVSTPLQRHVGTVLTVHVTNRADRSVVFVSLTDDEQGIAEEDRQLLEMLVSHTAMALDGIYPVERESH